MNKNTYRDAMRNWLTSQAFDLAVTYTFSDAIELKTADRLMQRYCSQIDRQLYGNAAWRNNKRVQRVNFAETGVKVQKRALLLEQTDGRLHIHSAVKMPADRFSDLNTFSDYLNTQWHSTSKLACRAKFVNIYSNNWLHYITKQTTAAECDAFLVNSSFIAHTDTF